MSLSNKKQKQLSEEEEKNSLETFAATFDQKSSRHFFSCPAIIKENNPLVEDNDKTLTVCHIHEKMVLIHYFDYAENALKLQANTGTAIFPIKEYWRIKGWIYDEDTGNLLARAFPYSPKVAISRRELERKLLSQRNNPKLKLRQYLEGIVGKIFTHKGKVYFSATRKIDALASRRDGQLSNEENLKECGVDISRFKNDNGIIYVVLLVHPRNQIQNPNKVTPKIYHLDTWGPEKELSGTNIITSNGKKNKTNNTNGISNSNNNRRLVRYENVDMKKFGISKLKNLTEIEALDAFDRNEMIYMQTGEEEAYVCFSDEVKHRLSVRGDKEHLYHQYVILDAKTRIELKECIAYAFKDEVANFPNRLNTDINQIVNYIINLYLGQELNHLQLENTSLYALYLTCKHLPSFKTDEAKDLEVMEKEVKEKLLSIKGNILYNLFSTYRTKVDKKRVKGSSAGNSNSVSPCPSDPALLSPLRNAE